MDKSTYYIVQTGEYTYARDDEHLGYTEVLGESNATHYSYARARDIYTVEKRLGWRGSPRRFPRIIKVTTEHKTITTNRR